MSDSDQPTKLITPTGQSNHIVVGFSPQGFLEVKCGCPFKPAGPSGFKRAICAGHEEHFLKKLGKALERGD